MEHSEKWTDCEVQALLSIYYSKDIQRGFASSKHNSKVYNNISVRLLQVGIHHSAKQCREKLKKLKQDYKKIKDNNNLNGSDQRTGKWYVSMDAILDHNPAYTKNVESRDSVWRKRKSTDTFIMLALKEMRELEEARRKEVNAVVDRLLQVLAERELREAAAWATELAEEQAEAAEARQQATFQQSFLDLFAKLVEGKQASVPSTLD
ncbi:zinc finger and SCAN domain-containing 29-like protein [Labeo rohita]|uniref:Zinc finger and SCAN domain-containing 29-like protein n=1 Tax=Labeo rohita TaxID=84645 RepID=A0A498N143_LABRO|nr:zinc finger and SCAN domain-containing 29-like protein [Labeo rohita]